MRKPFSTRQWKHPEGYKYLTPWANATLLRFLIRAFTETLPRYEYRLKNQLDDAGRSVVSNIEEGYKRPDTRHYLDFLGFSQGSLEEIKGLFRQAFQDGFIESKPESSLAGLGIDLKDFRQKLIGFDGDRKLRGSQGISEQVKGELRDTKGELGEVKGRDTKGELGEVKGRDSKGELGEVKGRDSKGELGEVKEEGGDTKGTLRDNRVSGFKTPVLLEVLYRPLKSIKGTDLTLEIFLELVNKTDWLFRKLVESLEKTLVSPGSFKKKYQVESDEFEEELKRLAAGQKTPKGGA